MKNKSAFPNFDKFNKKKFIERSLNEEEFVAITPSIQSISFIILNTPLFQTCAKNFFIKGLIRIMNFKKSSLKVNKSLGERSKFLLKSKKLGKSVTYFIIG